VFNESLRSNNHEQSLASCESVNCGCILHKQPILVFKLHHFSVNAFFLQICIPTTLLQPLGWHCAEYMVHHEWIVHKEKHHIHVARTSNNRVIMACYSIVACCHGMKLCAHAAWAFPIATKWRCDQDVKVVHRAAESVEIGKELPGKSYMIAGN